MGALKGSPPLFPGSSFPDEGQARLPREGEAAVDRFPPAVGNALSLRKERGLTTGSRSLLFLEE